MVKKEAEKILKYTRPHNLNSAHVNVKAKVIPVIIGVTGTISKSLRQYLSNVTGDSDIKELQKIAILVTAHIPREVLMEKYETYFKAK